MSYAAFVKVILTHSNGDQSIVSKQFENSNDYLIWLDEATDSFNESIATYGLRGYTVIQKVNGKILDVEHVSYDSRLNFVIRQSK